MLPGALFGILEYFKDLQSQGGSLHTLQSECGIGRHSKAGQDMRAMVFHIPYHPCSPSRPGESPHEAGHLICDRLASEPEPRSSLNFTRNGLGADAAAARAQSANLELLALVALPENAVFKLKPLEFLPTCCAL